MGSEMTRLPEARAVMSSAWRIGTPEAVRVPRVRAKRATAILRTMSPIFIGKRSLIVSQIIPPESERRHLRKAKTITNGARNTTYQ